MQRINVVNKKVYYVYNSKGELVELVLLDNDEYEINESWLKD